MTDPPRDTRREDTLSDYSCLETESDEFYSFFDVWLICGSIYIRIGFTNRKLPVAPMNFDLSRVSLPRYGQNETACRPEIFI